MQIAVLLGLVIMITYPATTLEQWEQFRGPGGQGHSQATGLPLRWSETENIIWKVSVPGLGWSSPVIAGGQIWITTAVDKGRSLKAVCFDQRSGELLHDIELFHRDDGGPLHSMNSYATPTPVIEDDRVYVHFGPAGTACLSTGENVETQVSPTVRGRQLSCPLSQHAHPQLRRNRRPIHRGTRQAERNGRLEDKSPAPRQSAGENQEPDRVATEVSFDGVFHTACDRS